MGMQWWQLGRTINKRNTYTDFINVAEHLISLGYTSSDRLAVRGRSAGGILAGSLLILKPSLFK
jgi:oligopeptidase B